jgi:hypothetical protein
MFFILHFSFFIEFCEAKFLWASRFGSFAASRRAIRSITFAAALRLPLRWFRYYPSRKKKALFFFQKSAFFYWGLSSAFAVEIPIAIPTAFAVASFMFFIYTWLTSCK